MPPATFNRTSHLCCRPEGPEPYACLQDNEFKEYMEVCSAAVVFKMQPGSIASGLQGSNHLSVLNRWTTSLTSTWKAWTPPSKMAVGRTREPALRLCKHPVSLQTHTKHSGRCAGCAAQLRSSAATPCHEVIPCCITSPGPEFSRGHDWCPGAGAMQVQLLVMSLCWWQPKMRHRVLAQLKLLDRRGCLCFTPCRHAEAQAHPRRASEAAE